MTVVNLHAVLITCLLDIVAVRSLVHTDDYYEKFNILGEPEHTMTKYKGVGEACYIGEKFIIVKSGSLTKEEKHKFVEVHNDYRRKMAKGETFLEPGGVFPYSADITEMTWDEELAGIAQRWAEQCPDDKPHDENQQVDLRSWVGQNMVKYLTSVYASPRKSDILSDVTIEEVINMWSKEALHYNSNQTFPNSSANETRNYTQLVWGKSSRLGCGIFVIKRDINYVVYIVCNYGPGGNLNGLPMYEPGLPASKCPPGTEANNGLCSIICHHDDFLCDSGRCIRLNELCDGNQDCDNGEDETVCAPISRTKRYSAGYELKCGNTRFECADGNCISLNWRCDGLRDCQSGDDENNCDSRKCGEENYECFSGRCIEFNRVCNGENDCEDSDDENNCEVKKCGSNKHECFNGKCIGLHLKCNGVSDCLDGDDETHCYSQKCGNYKFQCASGVCIRKLRVCDGSPDCEHGDDERNCFQNAQKGIHPEEQLVQNDQKGNHPEEQLEYNAKCSDSTVCRTSGAACINGRCQCDSTSVYYEEGVSDQCLKIVTNMNDRCVVDIQCTSFLGTHISIECSKPTGKCVCKSGYILDKKENKCRRDEHVGYNRPCSSSRVCMTTDAACIDGRCKCDRFTVYDYGLDKCLKIASHIEDRCEVNLQCTSSKYGTAETIECGSIGKCTCKDGFEYSPRSEICLEEEKAVEYSQPCSNASICRTTNARCINGRCQCDSLSVHNSGFNDECLKISSHIGDHCETDLQCTSSKFGNSDSVECASNEKCLCKKGFEYDPVRKQCWEEVKLVEYGDSCLKEDTCITIDASCIKGKCRCSLTHVYNKEERYDECLKRATSIGDQCVKDLQCLATDLGTKETVECSRKTNKCLCKQGAIYDKTVQQCKPDRGVIAYQGKCSKESICATFDATCINGRCGCPETHVYNNQEVFDECLKIATKIGDPCLTNSQCTSSSVGSNSSVECYKTIRKCKCKPGFSYDSLNKQCKPEQQLIEYKGECTKESTCITTGATCVDGRCKCSTSHVYQHAQLFDECLKIAEHLGDPCVSDRQCTFSSLGNMNSIHCSQRYGKCLCTSGYSYHTGENQCLQTTVNKKYEAACHRNSDCATFGSICRKGKCLCPENSVYHEEGFYDECLPVATEVGQPCKISLQCSLSLFGTESSAECSANKRICICKVGFAYNAGSSHCTKEIWRRVYNDTCKNANECLTLSATCIDGRCLCDKSTVYYDNGLYDQCLEVATNISDSCVISKQCTVSKLGTKTSIECSRRTGRCLCKSGFVFSVNKRKCVATVKHVAYKQICTKENICITKNAKCLENKCDCEPGYLHNDVGYYDECLKIATSIGESCKLQQQCTLSTLGNENSIECTKSKRCLCRERYTFHTSEQQCRKEKVHSRYRQACKKDAECVTVNAICNEGRCICKTTNVYHDSWFYDECLQIATGIGDSCKIDLQCTLASFGTTASTECSKVRKRCICKEGNTYDIIKEKCKLKDYPRGYGDACNKESVCITNGAKCLNSTCACDANYLYHSEGYFDDCLKIAEKLEDPCVIDEQCISKLGNQNAVQCYKPVRKCICRKGYTYSQTELLCKQDPLPRAYNESCSTKLDCVTDNVDCMDNTCKCPFGFVYNNLGYQDECLKIATEFGERCDISEQCILSAFGRKNSIHCSSLKKCVCKEGFMFDRSVSKCRLKPGLVDYGKVCRGYDLCNTIDAMCINGRCSCNQTYIYHNFQHYDQCLKIVAHIGDKCKTDKQCSLSKFGKNFSIHCDRTTHTCLCKTGYNYHVREEECLQPKVHQGYKQTCTKATDCATIDAICSDGLCACDINHVYNDIKYYDECLKIATNIGDRCAINLQCTLSTFGKKESAECYQRLRICLCKKGYHYSSKEKICKKREVIDMVMVNAALKQLDSDLQKVQKKLQSIDSKIAVDKNTNCTSGFTNIKGHCYALSRTKLSWLWSNIMCRSWGANLVSINTRLENRDLAHHVNELPELDGFWSGGHDFFSEGVYLWEATHRPFEYTSWRYREPSGGQEKQCVFVAASERQHLLWYTSWYGKQKHFMCEKNMEYEKTEVKENEFGTKEVESILDDFNRRLVNTQKALYQYSSPIPIVQRTSCAEGFVRIRNRCYYFGVIYNYWAQVKYLCKLWGAEMLSIETEEENNDLINYMQANFDTAAYWTSGTNLQDENTFLWHNHNKEPLTFTSWKNGQNDPPSGSELCVTFSVAAKPTRASHWTANFCGSRFRVACERPIEVSETLSYTEEMTGNRKVNATLENFRFRLNTLIEKLQIISSDIKVDPATNCSKTFFRLGKSCYYLSNFFSGWMNAEQYCRDWGSHLASIETAEENEAIRQHLQGRSEVWIGGNHILEVGTYRWEGSHKNLRFTAWAEGYPVNRSSASCVYIEEGKWKNGMCTYHTFFICESKLGVSN